MTDADWGRAFDPERLAGLELAMWKAYYRRQGARLFVLLVRANHEQAAVGWPGAFRAAFYLARAAVREAGSLRGQAAEARDRGAAADPESPTGAGQGYWPEVDRLLRESYLSLHRSVGVVSVNEAASAQ